MNTGKEPVVKVGIMSAPELRLDLLAPYTEPSANGAV